MKANASLQIGHGNENTVHYNMAVNNWRALEIASEPNNLMGFPELGVVTKMPYLINYFLL